ncbi:MAG: aldehyde dehydrogenase family protein, partial [gamma proteobacterium symbiont of Lucinoma myriamae]|nr:aldehyde dehydrogenase family protein [gamma proteobacterium symbiont of Lucinoma myriamae]
MKNTIKSINPANEMIIQEFPDWDMDEIAPIIEEADNAFEKWRLLDFAQRAQCFFSMAKLLRERKADYAILMANEMGKPVSQGEAEAEKCAWVCEHYAQQTAHYLADKNIVTENSESFVTFKPLGVIYMIMPWNFPFWQVIRGAAPTIMAGNTIVLKHASNVFACALAIEGLFKEAGFPENVFRSLLTGSRTSADIIAHPKIRAVTLTGSERAGQHVAAQAGQNLKKSVLELGGSDPYIILEDADIDLAVASCGASRMLNGGQVCIAAKRFIVVESKRAEFEGNQEKQLSLMDQFHPSVIQNNLKVA